MKLYIDENNKVVTMHEATSDMKCFEEFENRKPYSFDGVKELENCIHPIHVLLNTSRIGKEKYTKIKGLSVHYCAAYVINRRGMGFVD